MPSRRWDPDAIVDSYILTHSTRPEVVELREQKSWRAWLVDQMLGIGVVLIAVIVVTVFTSSTSRVVFFLVLFGALIYLVIRGLQAHYTRYVITDFRILRASGVVNRRVDFIPWRKVTDVGLRQSFLQYLLGSATILIYSASENSGFEAISDVREPMRFYQELVEKVDLFQGRAKTEDVSSSNPDGRRSRTPTDSTY